MKSLMIKAVALAALSLGALGVASAGLITGTYSLISTTGGSIAPTGSVIATGTYAVDNTALILPQYTDPHGNEFPFAAPLTAFTFVENVAVTGGALGNTNFGLGDFADPQPVAILSGFGGNVLSLYGNTGDIDDDGQVVRVLELTLDADGSTGEYTIAYVDSDGNNNTVFGVSSGTQSIPEPTALALLGAGVVAFGVGRRRKRASLAVG